MCMIHTSMVPYPPWECEKRGWKEGKNSLLNIQSHFRYIIYRLRVYFCIRWLLLWEEYVLLPHPAGGLTTEESSILLVQEEFFDPFLEKNRILASFYIDYCLFRWIRSEHILDRLSERATRECMPCPKSLAQEREYMLPHHRSNEKK